MHDELNQFDQLKVWELVPLPDSKKALGTRWVFRNKQDDSGDIVRNKGRHVVQGFRQVEGFDYDEVYAPVARLEAIRLFLAYASYMGFTVYQMDVKTSFLYGKAPQAWYATLTENLLSHGYTLGTIDQTLFRKSMVVEVARC
ncbi:hypothetical protein E3N88_28929 [Mikania micrantha]|uniref:Reverse transcriptase Ty1/copia-type domain-containing protein n=1 Tax=Mikania micrantha TaxID=192012 RepID=A0A5N6N170_9ASTR|nr:hypothetical protein E3N88_28929 [Mikania micrantha]